MEGQVSFCVGNQNVPQLPALLLCSTVQSAVSWIHLLTGSALSRLWEMHGPTVVFVQVSTAWQLLSFTIAITCGPALQQPVIQYPFHQDTQPASHRSPEKKWYDNEQNSFSTFRPVLHAVAAEQRWCHYNSTRQLQWRSAYLHISLTLRLSKHPKFKTRV